MSSKKFVPLFVAYFHLGNQVSVSTTTATPPGLHAVGYSKRQAMERLLGTVKVEEQKLLNDHANMKLRRINLEEAIEKSLRRI